MINENDFRQFQYNIIGAKSKITGDVLLSGDAIITSHIEGSLEILDLGKLVLERGSFIQGKVKASDIEIFGQVEGDIICSGLVSIRSSAQVTGSIKSSRLVIYPGAIVEMTADSQDENQL